MYVAYHCSCRYRVHFVASIAGQRACVKDPMYRERLGYSTVSWAKCLFFIVIYYNIAVLSDA
jgi:hypothetical protein